MWKILLVLAVLTAFAFGAKADPNSQALISALQVKAQQCYPDSRYIVVDRQLVPKPPQVEPQKITVYAPAYPVYYDPWPRVYVGVGYTYWGGRHGGHCGHHHGGHR